jgi:hypothetical protein
MEIAKNVCCPDLAVVDCADTEEHRHFACLQSRTPISNQTVRDLCSRDWETCALFTLVEHLHEIEED